MDIPEALKNAKIVRQIKLGQDDNAIDVVLDVCQDDGTPVIICLLDGEYAALFGHEYHDRQDGQEG